MQYQQFNSVTTDLQPGVNLIEASAGTGKTYAIAMLALRFIVEKGLAIDELLIVTFTKAATEELKERVRIRLNEVRQVFAGNSQGIDPNIIDWVEQLDTNHNEAKRRVELALLDIDQAGIFTIHGFCQRVLKEHALESGQLFDAELSSDVSAIYQACADDFWRREVYQRTMQQAAVLLNYAATPDALLASINFITPDMPVYPSALKLDEALDDLCGLAETAGKGVINTALALRQAFADGMFKASYQQSLEDYWPDLQDWSVDKQHGFPAVEALQLLTEAGISEGLNGNKFRKNKDYTTEQRKQQYLGSLAIEPQAAEKLLVALNRVALAFRYALLAYINENLQQRMQQLNLLSFDDLILRVNEVLHQENRKLLRNALRQRFKAALIDEFQDTDSKQWFIFSTLFADQDCYLFLIGDPKQAIYKFRGADIFSYFDAQQRARHLFTLDKNWRSHPSLVAAVNMLFQHHHNAFLFERLVFNPVRPALAEKDGWLSETAADQAPMEVWQLAESETKNGYWSSGKADTAIQIAVAEEILRLLDPAEECTLQCQDKPPQPLTAGDIAILVRTHAQARQYQALLRQVGIPSVLNSNESVFASDQAHELFVLLQAIAQPGDINRLKQALTLSWFNLDGPALYQLSNDESKMDDWLSRFQGYYQQWQTRGLMAMMLQLLEQEQVQQHLSRCIDAERQLTNLHHLLELLQQAALDEHLGLNKTLDWLQSAITGHGSAGDEQQLRLESDEQAVKIVTMHSAKGLEYPVVFCSSLWQRSGRLFNEKQLIKCHEDGRMIADLGSDDFERRREQALFEELAEDLRVLYVAVTRAKYRCYVIWANERSEKKRNDSAMDYLLFFRGEQNFADQQQTLQALCAQSNEAFGYRLITPGAELTGRSRTGGQPRQLSALRQTRALRTDWQMSSYTALSALSLSDSPELPQDKVQEAVEGGGQDDAEVLPKGARTGNVVHELLEKTDFAVLGERGDISQQIAVSCLRYGLQLQQSQTQSLQVLLQNAVLTPLSEQDAGFCLANIESKACLKEMPFYLSLAAISTRQVNQLLQDSAAFQPLSAKQMQGYLTGFIDLVCEYQGRYYVMDYKTNSLADYRADSLTDAMREHNYGLQYWIYTLVLHHYLQQRLPDYDYQRHFGGVRYLFVRGMQQRPLSGVYQYCPEWDKLHALAELFGGRR